MYVVKEWKNIINWIKEKQNFSQPNLKYMNTGIQTKLLTKEKKSVIRYSTTIIFVSTLSNKKCTNSLWNEWIQCNCDVMYVDGKLNRNISRTFISDYFWKLQLARMSFRNTHLTKPGQRTVFYLNTNGNIKAGVGRVLLYASASSLRCLPCVWVCLQLLHPLVNLTSPKGRYRRLDYLLEHQFSVKPCQLHT